jgi:hypothetical protein
MSGALWQQNTEFQARRCKPDGTHKGLSERGAGCGKSRTSGSEVAVGEATPSPTIPRFHCIQQCSCIEDKEEMP